MSKEPAEEPYELRATSTVRRALSESLPGAVAVAAYGFITGPLLLALHQTGKRLLSPDERQVLRASQYLRSIVPLPATASRSLLRSRRMRSASPNLDTAPARQGLAPRRKTEEKKADAGR